MNWPEKAKASLFVPQKVQSQTHYELNGIYQTAFTTAICWPGEVYINMLVAHMLKHGWKRRDEDFLNPSFKPSWARGGSIDEKWGHFLEKDAYVQQWIEDWDDPDENLIRYVLKYKTEGKRNIPITPQDCELQVVAIFVPKEIRQRMVAEIVSRKNEKVK